MDRPGRRFRDMSRRPQSPVSWTRLRLLVLAAGVTVLLVLSVFGRGNGFEDASDAGGRVGRVSRAAHFDTANLREYPLDRVFTLSQTPTSSNSDHQQSPIPEPPQKQIAPPEPQAPNRPRTFTEILMAVMVPERGGRNGNLVLRDWGNWQISSGVGGEALEEAMAAVNVMGWVGERVEETDPWKLVVLGAMAEEAREIEGLFDGLLETAPLDDSTLDALEVGRGKNAVLHLYAASVCAQIQLRMDIDMVVQVEAEIGLPNRLAQLALDDINAQLITAVQRDRERGGKRSLAVYHGTHV
ncbi:hypothetical protein PYCC9005_005996 [Savitreella phatthalungensis]